jgi:lipid A 3-O-deacylase
LVRKITRFVIAGLASAIVTLAGGTAWAEQPQARALDDRFNAGTMEVEVFAGGACALAWGGIRETYNYAEGQLRLGWMLNTPSEGPGFFRGNFEFLVSATGADIYNGPGSKFGAADLMFRYNFVQPNARLVPYYQSAVGLFVSDIANDKTQAEIGSATEIDVQSALGLRFLLTPQWSLNAEFSYHHVSNAGLADPNVGINAIGGMFGVSRSF